MEIIEEFNPKEHICKFGFELHDHATGEAVRYNILGDIYQRELVFEFIGQENGDVVQRYGFPISKEKMETLLPLIRWKDFEKCRDMLEVSTRCFKAGNCGYRDGWWYYFWCLSESGMPLIEIDIEYLFDKKQLPAFEKLLLDKFGNGMEELNQKRVLVCSKVYRKSPKEFLLWGFPYITVDNNLKNPQYFLLPVPKYQHEEDKQRGNDPAVSS